MRLFRYEIEVDGDDDFGAILAVDPVSAIRGVFREVKPLVVGECFSGYVKNCCTGENLYWEALTIMEEGRLGWHFDLRFSQLWVE